MSTIKELNYKPIIIAQNSYRRISSVINFIKENASYLLHTYTVHSILYITLYSLNNKLFITAVIY